MKELYDDDILEAIVNSLVKCVKYNSMSELTRDAFHFYQQCNGVKKFDNKLEMSAVFDYPEKYENTLAEELWLYRDENQFEDIDSDDDDYLYFRQRRSIYNSVISAITRKKPIKITTGKRRRRTLAG